MTVEAELGSTEVSRKVTEVSRKVTEFLDRARHSWVADIQGRTPPICMELK